MKRILKYSLFFFILIVLQLLVFNNIQFSGYINPYIYIMFIIILPLFLPSWLVLLLSFATGLIMDIFTGAFGVHTFATVMAGFSRPWLYSLNATREESDPVSAPSVNNNGLRWFLLFTLMIVFIHHLSLFFVEVFSFTNFFLTLTRVILSTLFTTFFIVLIDIIVSKK